jgi:signal peptidase I
MSASPEPRPHVGPRAPESASPPEQGWQALGDQLRTLAIAVLIALAIRAFLIEPYRIPSESMLPTLLVGDHLFVNKFVYGVQIPFLSLRLPGLREPARGDVVVFSVAKDGHAIHPADLRPDLPRERFVKRIVGLPGDSVEVRDEQVWVNGQLLGHSPVEGVVEDEVGRDLRVVREQLGDREHLASYDPERSGPTGNFAVAPGRYFMMGDNRDDSNDSRKWGTVRLDEFKGPAFLLYWSWDWNGSWGELMYPTTWWTLLTDRVRWSRVGDAIR